MNLIFLKNTFLGNTKSAINIIWAQKASRLCQISRHCMSDKKWTIAIRNEAQLTPNWRERVNSIKLYERTVWSDNQNALLWHIWLSETIRSRLIFIPHFTLRARGQNFLTLSYAPTRIHACIGVGAEKTRKISHKRGEKWAVKLFTLQKSFRYEIMKRIIQRDVRFQSCFNLTSFQINFLFLPEKKRK